MSKEIGLKYQLSLEHELVKRGFVVCEVLGDYSPYDIVSDYNGKINRIQVRSTHRRLSKRNRGFKVQCTVGNHQVILNKDMCDFLVIIGGKTDKIYIIPIEKINQKTIIIHPDKETYPKFQKQEKRMKWEEYEEAWGLLK